MIKNKDLSSMNTFGISVKTALYAEFKDEKELELLTEDMPDVWYVLGGGSNTLFTQDYEGVIIHPTGTKIEVIEESDNTVTVRAEAGVVWDDLVAWCVDRGYSGVENLSYIPGSVGASPVQNIGAYGSEAKDCIESVRAWLPKERRYIELKNEDCRFAYRDSIFKHELKGSAIVTSVTFRLSKIFIPNIRYGDLSKLLEGKEINLRTVRDAIISVRQSKLPEPLEIGNGGSFFKNPVITHNHFNQIREQYPMMPFYEEQGGVKVPAGWLIDTAGWKGYRDGCVGVHENQALVLVNYGEGNGEQVMILAYKIIDDIKQKFGVELHPEINVL